MKQHDFVFTVKLGFFWTSGLFLQIRRVAAPHPIKINGTVLVFAPDVMPVLIAIFFLVFAFRRPPGPHPQGTNTLGGLPNGKPRTSIEYESRDIIKIILAV
jgi:hypothetical protein